MSLQDFLEDSRVVALVCNQWGDTGKGKLIDLLTDWADVIVRGHGGANAGHTIEAEGKRFATHLVPSGILYDKDGKTNVIGSGVALDPRALLKELDELEAGGVSHDCLRIAYNAHLLLPQHIIMDKIKEAAAGASKIGTTGRGIGPLYTDEPARIRLQVSDLFNRDVFARKLARNLRDKVTLLRDYNPGIVVQVMKSVGLEWKPGEIFDTDAIIEEYSKLGERIRDMTADTDAFVKESRIHGDKILLEGAHGLLLSVKHGTYPYVTSSDCSVAGLASGAGLSPRDVDRALGIVKAFYMTRVGAGPFPTEFGGEKSAVHCDTPGMNKEREKNGYPDLSAVNDTNEFLQGVAIRRAGNEYGATTGRPRRTGWLDLPLLRYASRINGEDVVLTKVDVLNQCEIIKLCTHYVYRGDDYCLGDRTLHRGDKINVAIPQADVLEKCQPVYTEFDGWMRDISGAREFDELPGKLKDIVKNVGFLGDVNVVGVSTGAKREEMIWR